MLLLCVVVWKMVCTCVLTIMALIRYGCSRAVFGAVGFIMGHNETTANSALGGIYRSNWLSLV